MELQKNSPWYQYLELGQQLLVETSFTLLERREFLTDLKDYSFIVFPMAKTYEGFLKKVFFDLHLIDRGTYEGRRFRIGRALNPDIRNHQRDEDWLYDDAVEYFGEDVARQLWDVWLVCRNHIFHYWPDGKQELTLDAAEKRLVMMVEVMQLTVEQINHKKNHLERLNYVN
jgi:hypothetical protein